MICPACSAENEATAEACFTCGKALYALTQGAVLAGRYEIVSPLGQGGMGRVYKAYDRVLEEHVALKVLRPEFAREADMARRFLSEIKLARKVSHPNVCRIHEYGEEGGLRYISMEWIDGMSLKDYLRARRLTVADAFELALGAAGGLQAVHERGIIHRDFKTSNIMVDQRGRVRLLDFGIARVAGAEHGHVHRGRPGRGHARIHEPGAGAGRAAGLPQRHLRAGLRGVRDLQRRRRCSRERRRWSRSSSTSTSRRRSTARGRRIPPALVPPLRIGAGQGSGGALRDGGAVRGRARGGARGVAARRARRGRRAARPAPATPAETSTLHRTPAPPPRPGRPAAAGARAGRPRRRRAPRRARPVRRCWRWRSTTGALVVAPPDAARRARRHAGPSPASAARAAAGRLRRRPCATSRPARRRGARRPPVAPELVVDARVPDLGRVTTGRLRLTVIPPAEVTVDGRLVGTVSAQELTPAAGDAHGARAAPGLQAAAADRHDRARRDRGPAARPGREGHPRQPSMNPPLHLDPALRALLAVAAMPLAGARAAPAPPRDAELAAGIALARAGDFQGALLKLDETVRRLEAAGAPDPELAQGYLYLGDLLPGAGPGAPGGRALPRGRAPRPGAAPRSRGVLAAGDPLLRGGAPGGRGDARAADHARPRHLPRAPAAPPEKQGLRTGPCSWSSRRARPPPPRWPSPAAATTARRPPRRCRPRPPRCAPGRRRRHAGPATWKRRALAARSCSTAPSSRRAPPRRRRVAGRRRAPRRGRPRGAGRAAGHLAVRPPGHPAGIVAVIAGVGAARPRRQSIVPPRRPARANASRSPSKPPPDRPRLDTRGAAARY